MSTDRRGKLLVKKGTPCSCCDGRFPTNCKACYDGTCECCYGTGKNPDDVYEADAGITPSC